jgi:acetyl esterase/lipase
VVLRPHVRIACETFQAQPGFHCMMRLILVSLIVAAPLGAQQPPAGQFKAWDKDADGKLVAAELPERLRPIFGQVDTDGDGFITQQEHRGFLARRAPQQPAGQKPRQTPGAAPPARLPDSVEVHNNLDYAGGGNPRQMLDLVLPKQRAAGGKLPLIVFIHGGGWRSGSKEGSIRRLLPFVETGEYAGATLNYRLTGESSWPTQIHDCKAAIRYLRGNAGKFGIDPDKIAVWGSSAGGHLVSLLGTSGGVKELEGELGEFDGQSSRVTCVVNYFGPENFLTMVRQKSNIDRSRGSQYPEALLLGGPLQEIEAAARQASPVTWVSQDDPPFLTAHGTEDPVVPFAQGEEIHAALQKAGVESHLIRVQGAGHGFAAPEVEQRVKAFLTKHLLGRDAVISAAPVGVRGGKPAR